MHRLAIIIAALALASSAYAQQPQSHPAPLTQSEIEYVYEALQDVDRPLRKTEPILTKLRWMWQEAGKPVAPAPPAETPAAPAPETPQAQ